MVDPEQLVGGDGTVGMALRLWSSKNGPVTYNDWQSVYFQLIKAGFEDEEAGEVPPQPDGDNLNFNRRRQHRISRMYRDIQTEIHGVDFGEQAVRKLARAKVGFAPKSKPAPTPKAKALAATRRAELVDAMCQADTLVQWQTQAAANGALAPQTVSCLTADGLQCQAGVASDSAVAAVEGVRIPTYAIDTPREVPIPSAANVDHLWADEQAQLVVQEYAVSQTELTKEMDDRMAMITDVLSHMETATQPGLAFVVKVENTVKEYKDFYGEWVAPGCAFLEISKIKIRFTSKPGCAFFEISEIKDRFTSKPGCFFLFVIFEISKIMIRFTSNPGCVFCL